MVLAETLQTIRFRFLQPTRHVHMPLPLFESHDFWFPQYACDRCNTIIPFLDGHRKKALLKVSAMRKMSSLAIGAIINECVRLMPSEACYLNIGTWMGYSFFAGMAANPDKHCIGVDSFVQFGGPRQRFLRRFQKLRSNRHEFFETDWRVYMRAHAGKIGVLFYDAAHDEVSQFDAMMLADPFIVSGGIIIVDDTNWSSPRNAVLAFLRQKNNYRLLLDQPTAGNCHPTFWNGIMVLQKCS